MASSSAIGNKRQRTDSLQTRPAPVSAREQAPTEAELRSAIDTLSPELIKSTLLGIALQQSDVSAVIIGWYQENLEKRRKTVVDFDNLSKQVWRDLNVTHSRERESQKYESGLDVAGDVLEVRARGLPRYR